MRTLKKMTSSVLLIFFCTSCNIDDIKDKIQEETCDIIIDKLYDEYADDIQMALDNDGLTEEEKIVAIEEYEAARDKEIAEAEQSCLETELF